MKKIILLVLAITFAISVPVRQTWKWQVHAKETAKVKIQRNKVSKIVKEMERFSAEQIELLRKVYQTCKPYSLGNTCLAITFQESKVGKYMAISATGDYGLMGINLKTYINDRDLSLNYYGKLALITKLIRNDKFNINAAIQNLQNWQKVYKHYRHKWRLIWGSYNGGTFPNKHYAQHILNIIYAYKRYFRKHPDIEKYIKK